MDIEEHLKKLQSLFTYTLSDANMAKARYLGLSQDPEAKPAIIARAKLTWRQLETRKTAIVARMVELEELEHEAVV